MFESFQRAWKVFLQAVLPKVELPIARELKNFDKVQQLFGFANEEHQVETSHHVEIREGVNTIRMNVASFIKIDMSQGCPVFAIHGDHFDDNLPMQNDTPNMRGIPKFVVEVLGDVVTVDTDFFVDSSRKASVLVRNSNGDVIGKAYTNPVFDKIADDKLLYKVDTWFLVFNPTPQKLLCDKEISLS